MPLNINNFWYSNQNLTFSAQHLHLLPTINKFDKQIQCVLVIC